MIDQIRATNRARLVHIAFRLAYGRPPTLEESLQWGNRLRGEASFPNFLNLLKESSKGEFESPTSMIHLEAPLFPAVELGASNSNERDALLTSGDLCIDSSVTKQRSKSLEQTGSFPSPKLDMASTESISFCAPLETLALRSARKYFADLATSNLKAVSPRIETQGVK